MDFSGVSVIHQALYKNRRLLADTEHSSPVRIVDLKGFSGSPADLQKSLERMRSPPAAQCTDGKGCKTAWSSQAGCTCCPWDVFRRQQVLL